MKHSCKLWNAGEPRKQPHAKSLCWPSVRVSQYGRLRGDDLPHSCSRSARTHFARRPEAEAAFSRRNCLVATLVLAFPHSSSMLQALAEGELQQYRDGKGTYTLQRPKDWQQVDKAGADTLFKAQTLRSTDLGVTVSPIRIANLGQFGDVSTVAERLLAAERKKESTKSTELLEEGREVAKSGTTFYIYDYTISTTRGDKRILSKVGVADGKLYIVNGSIKCEAFSCKESTALVEIVKQCVHSFDVLT